MYIFFLLKSSDENALTNSAEDITRMTLAGEKTEIKVSTLEEMKNMLFLCQLETNLYRLNATLCDKEYDELVKLFLQIINLKNLKVCYILLLT